MRVVSGYVCLLIFAFSCDLRPVVRSNEGSLETKTELVEQTVPSELAIAFEGVSFRYDPRVFGGIKQEIVPEHKLEEPTDKPDNVAPQHIRFEFEFGREPGEAQIEVFPIGEFPEMYAVNPETVDYVEKEIEGLRRVLKDPSYRRNREIPHLPLIDVSDHFYVKVRNLNFENGNGIIFITHWSHGADLVSNRNLIYRFEGITADGKYYVTAKTPLSVGFLPDEVPEEFEGYTYKNLYEGHSNSKEAIARIEKYRKSITTRLEKLNPKDFSPSLEKLEAIISSLRIDKTSPEK